MLREARAGETSRFAPCSIFYGCDLHVVPDCVSVLVQPLAIRHFFSNPFARSLVFGASLLLYRFQLKDSSIDQYGTHS